MPYYYESSDHKLLTCSPNRQKLFRSVIKFHDNTIIQGHRSKEEHRENLRTGKSTTENSKHLLIPSKAVDASPYPIPKDWGSLEEVLKGFAPHDRKRITDIIKERMKFYYFAGRVQGHADLLEIPNRWGGNWDGDADFSDQTFDDLVHFEDDD